jgi:hypothetical protein
MGAIAGMPNRAALAGRVVLPGKEYTPESGAGLQKGVNVMKGRLYAFCGGRGYRRAGCAGRAGWLLRG